MGLKTALIIAHLIGLAIGVGGATLLDLIIMRFMVRGRISREQASIVQLASTLVTAGLVLLWLSGLGFLVYYYAFTPESLANPKVHAKIAIVAALTLNGVLIHHYILPVIRKNVGRQLFDGVSVARKRGMLALGAVSATSWYVPLALGALRELNFAVPATQILAAYVCLLLTAILFAQIMGAMLDRQGHRQAGHRRPKHPREAPAYSYASAEHRTPARIRR